MPDSLFASHHCHADDPQTSRAAAAKASTFAGTHAETVLLAIRANPGRNVKELERMPLFAGWAQYEVRRRVSDLAKDGAIREVGIRDGCRVWEAN